MTDHQEASAFRRLRSVARASGFDIKRKQGGYMLVHLEGNTLVAGRPLSAHAQGRGGRTAEAARAGVRLMNRIDQIKASAERDAASSLNIVEVLLSVLVEKMTDIHGGTFKTHVDHEHGVVMVAARLEKSR